MPEEEEQSPEDRQQLERYLTWRAKHDRDRVAQRRRQRRRVALCSTVAVAGVAGVALVAWWIGGERGGSPRVALQPAETVQSVTPAPEPPTTAALRPTPEPAPPTPIAAPPSTAPE